MIQAVQVIDKQERQDAIDQVRKKSWHSMAGELTEEEWAEQEKDMNTVLDQIVKEEVRRLILEESKRPDGRAVEEIRPLSSEIDVLPRTHGSGIVPTRTNPGVKRLYVGGTRRCANPGWFGFGGIQTLYAPL